MPLGFDGICLTAVTDGVRRRMAKLSQGCIETIKGLTSKGFSFCGAKVQFIVAWKADTDTEESAVVLADLIWKK